MARDQSTAPHVLRAKRYWLVPESRNTSRENTKRALDRWPRIVEFSGQPDGVAKAVAAKVTKRHLWQLERHTQLFFDTSPDFEERLKSLAAPVLSEVATQQLPSEEEESRFPEGVAKYRLHRALERDTALARKVKAQRLLRVGLLACDACGFDFERKYGMLGHGFIEAHHTIPVSKLDGHTRTKSEDLALVCSNCHRMLHSGEALLTIEQLRGLLRAQGET